MRKVMATLGALVVVLTAMAPAGAKSSTPTVGTKIRVSNGSVKFWGYEQPVSADGTGKDPADPGQEYAAVDVEACSTATRKQQVTPFMFTLVLPEGSKEHATVTVKQPPMYSALLSKGDCTRGWVTFEVPQGSRATQLTFGVPGGTPSKWKVPPS